MNMQVALVSCFVLLGLVQGACALSFTITPQEITLSCETPEKEEQATFSLTLGTSDTPWVLLASLEDPPPAGIVLLRTLQGKDPIPLSSKPTPILWGREAFPEGVKLDFTILFTPPWTLEAGTYTSHLVLYYQREGMPPLPIVQGPSLSLKVHKAFAIDIQGGQKVGTFEISGPPGLYPLQEPLTLTARANVTPWALLCTTQGLTGDKGGYIPPSRIFVEVGGKWHSLDKPVCLATAKGGEVVVFEGLSFSIETTSSDPPGKYTGAITFTFSLAAKGGIP